MIDSTFDDIKGRAKEAAGDATGDDDLEREGKIHRATGWVKDKVDELSDKVKGPADGDGKPALVRDIAWLDSAPRPSNEPRRAD